MHNLVLLLILTVALTACGLKGPLYLPAPKPVATPPAAAAAETPADTRKSPGSK